MVFDQLKIYRISNNREFFKIQKEVAITCIKYVVIIINNMTAEQISNKFEEFKKQNNIIHQKQILTEDQKHEIFLKKIDDLKKDDNNIFESIKIFNNWFCIFPTNKQLNKVKLNNELIDRIFEEFHFRDLKKISKPKPIIKNIYNTFFKKNVIDSITKDNKNCSLKISDEVHNMFNYGLDNNTTKNDFKQVKYLKINWLKNISSGEGAKECVMNSKKTNEITVHLHTNKNGHMWANIEPSELSKLVQTNISIHEVNQYFLKLDNNQTM
jgi:hypothetical protein